MKMYRLFGGYGKDQMLLAVFAYNVGPYAIPFNKTAIPDERCLVRDCRYYYRNMVMNTGKSVVASSFLRSLV